MSSIDCELLKIVQYYNLSLTYKECLFKANNKIYVSNMYEYGEIAIYEVIKTSP